MVVDDIENDAEPGGVTRFDQPFETGGSPVGVMRSEEIRAVIAPPTIAGELSDRHQLKGVDAELAEVGEAVDHTVEGPLWRERPDVQLIKDEAGEGQAAPARVSPRVQVVVDDLGEAEHTVRLRSRAWVGSRLGPLDREAVARPRTGRRI